MPARRMLILVAILMGLTALVAGLAAPVTARAGRADAGGGGDLADAAGRHPGREDDRGRPSRRRSPSSEGDLVRLTVKGQVLDVVELVGLDLTAADRAGDAGGVRRARRRAGRYPLRLVEDQREVGTLRVSPARE